MRASSFSGVDKAATPAERVYREADLCRDVELWWMKPMHEIKSFIDDKVFNLVRRDAVNIRTMDCIWVRKWKRKPIPKDRGEVNIWLVVRGSLIPQRGM